MMIDPLPKLKRRDQAGLFEYDYDRGEGAIRVTTRIHPLTATTPAVASLLQQPLTLWPEEAEWALDGRGDYTGWLLPARPDVVRRLRSDIGLYPETDAFREMARCYEENVRQQLAILSDPNAPTIPYVPEIPYSLYPVQSKAIDFVLRNRFALLAMDPGVGKTITALYAACALAAQGLPRWLIVGTGAAVAGPWFKELEACSLPYGEPEGGAGYGLSPFTLTTYEQLLTDLRLGRITTAFLAETFDGLIVDESQSCANPENATFLALRELRPYLKSVMLLNGTPIYNNLSELHTQVDLIRPGKLGSWEAFAHRHGISEGPCRAVVQELLGCELVDSVFVGRLEDTGRELPPLKQRTLWVPMGDEQQAIFDGLTEQMRDAPREERIGYYPLLQQVCNDSGLLAAVYTPGYSAKKAVLAELLPQVTALGRKCVVYASSREWIDTLSEEYRCTGMPLAYVGGLGASRRTVLRRFEEDPNEKILWINSAGTKALNLQHAHTLIMLEPCWSLEYDQAVARLRRSDTPHPITVIRVFADTWFERKKWDLYNQKAPIGQDIRDIPDLIAAGIVSVEEVMGL